jgi:hypothetical protein
MTLSPSVQLITDATVAQYIHEISVRHRPQSSDSQAWQAAQPRVDEVAAIRRRREREAAERAAA